jgi:hypothetical protein
LEAETNKYCPGGYDFGAISNLITWVLNFFLSAAACEDDYFYHFIIQDEIFGIKFFFILQSVASVD